MRGPARAAGLGELQHSLESGFDIFKAMKGADEFIAFIAARERALAEALFAAGSAARPARRRWRRRWRPCRGDALRPPPSAPDQQRAEVAHVARPGPDVGQRAQRQRAGDGIERPIVLGDDDERLLADAGVESSPQLKTAR